MACDLFGAVAANDPNLRQTVIAWVQSCPSTGKPIPISVRSGRNYILYCCEPGSLPASYAEGEEQGVPEEFLAFPGEALLRLVEEGRASVASLEIELQEERTDY